MQQRDNDDYGHGKYANTPAIGITNYSGSRLSILEKRKLSCKRLTKNIRDPHLLTAINEKKYQKEKRILAAKDSLAAGATMDDRLVRQSGQYLTLTALPVDPAGAIDEPAAKSGSGRQTGLTFR